MDLAECECIFPLICEVYRGRQSTVALLYHILLCNMVTHHGYITDSLPILYNAFLYIYTLHSCLNFFFLKKKIVGIYLSLADVMIHDDDDDDDAQKN
ncbi:hypothetical protein QBC42DRAFT_67860 [Cladorrhinum samala]|uniref:Uncharacterized protein n=1 Tax=Cladorrhinum samala TaxID=585594 RepID=A0AAV9H6Q3_9PEZI|nr:hypothetical protein QBC42DRAFT_67860 [Cladorrhinum samala]